MPKNLTWKGIIIKKILATNAELKFLNKLK